MSNVKTVEPARPASMVWMDKALRFEARGKHDAAARALSKAIKCEADEAGEVSDER